MAVRDLNDEQRFGLIDREERLLATARTMRVDDFVRHARAQAADVVAELANAAGRQRRLQPRRPAGADDGTSADATESAGSDGVDDTPSPAVDPAVVEYERQRAASKMRRWRDADTGLCMTLLALDPIRDAVLKTAYDRHLNTLRASGITSDLPWRQVEVDAMLHAITHGVTRSEGPLDGTTGPTRSRRAENQRRVEPAAHPSAPTGHSELSGRVGRRCRRSAW